LLFGDRQGVEEHGLADPAQAGDQHALLRPAARSPGEQDAEGLDLLVATGQGRRAGSGAGRERVADWVDRAKEATYRWFIGIA
jgi:hypothetical protein